MSTTDLGNTDQNGIWKGGTVDSGNEVAEGEARPPSVDESVDWWAIEDATDATPEYLDPVASPTASEADSSSSSGGSQATDTAGERRIIRIMQGDRSGLSTAGIGLILAAAALGYYLTDGGG